MLKPKKGRGRPRKRPFRNKESGLNKIDTTWMENLPEGNGKKDPRILGRYLAKVLKEHNENEEKTN